MKASYEISPDNPKYGEYCAAYREWMYTPGNAYKCSECPQRMENWQGHEFPGCQQNCWVIATCHPEWLKF